MENLVPKAEKKHQIKKSGAKHDKKEANRKKKLGLSTQRHNPKAFSVANLVRTKRTQQRNLDRQQKKEVVPLANRTIDIELPPPVLIVIMGPASVGKTTLIRSLVKIFTGQNLSDTKGPITCVTGRKRRVTFFECPLDMYSMTDLAKVADLVLLMVDASYGFEMETFEYLNMLQLHGFPKVIGVLTHLDKFKMNKTLQNTKKILKHRFWTEIYKGAKMFELSGTVNGKYLKHEVKRLSLYLTRVKFRPLTWRNTHPYVVIDRVDDITPMSAITSDADCDRDVALYGYLRGTHLKEAMRMHLIGAGDFDMANVTFLPDPCPLPGGSNSQDPNAMVKKVSLKAKDALLYAPMANIGRVQISDRDGVYIELKDIYYTKKEHLSVNDQSKPNGSNDDDDNDDNNGNVNDKYHNTPMGLLRDMQDVKVGVDELMGESEMTLFPGSRPVKSMSVSNIHSQQSVEDEDDGDDYDQSDDEEQDDEDEDGDEEDDEEEEEDEEDIDGELLGDDDYDGQGNDDDDDYEHLEEDEEKDKRNSKARSSAIPHSTFSQGKRSTDNGGHGLDNGMPETDGSSGTSWRTNMKDKALSSYLDRLRNGSQHDLMRRVYGESLNASAKSNSTHTDEEDDDDEDDDDLFMIKANSSKIDKYNEMNACDSNRNNASALIAAAAGVVSDEGVQSSSSSLSRNNDKLKANRLDQWMAVLCLNQNEPTSDDMNEDEDEETTQNIKSSEMFTALKERFVTGSWGGTNVSLKASNNGSRKGRVNTGGDDDSNEDGEGGNGDEEEVYGDYEDLQTGEKFGNNMKSRKSSKFSNEEDDDDDNEDADGYDFDQWRDGDEDEDDNEEEDEENVETGNEEIDRQLRQLNAEKKQKFKAKFDDQYDNKFENGGDEDDAENGASNGDGEKTEGGDSRAKARKDEKTRMEQEELEEQRLYDMAKKLQEQQRERNKMEFGEEGEVLRIRHEGYRQGMYLRIILKNVPVEFIRNFRSELPVVLGGLLPHESTLGLIKARVKRHRWYEKILKSNDPLIYSIGWRRYQSLPVFTIEDQNQRERFLKYTPEHMHCTCTFYGPIVPPNVGILAYQKVSRAITGFRVCLTGIVLEQQATPAVLKKLKLVGTPTKIFKNTAFITGMFNSGLEVAKFEGAKLKTVSGIRGQIKKAVKDGQPGSFRASFEDKILMSDIVICRLWVPVEVKKFYNPVVSLLTVDPSLKSNSKSIGDVLSASSTSTSTAVNGWQGMRPQAQIRREEQIPIHYNKDSIYKPVERQTRVFNKVNIPKKLQEALPYKSKSKLEKAQSSKSYIKRRAVILEPEDRKKRSLMQMISTISKDKQEKRKKIKIIKSIKNNKTKAKEQEKWEPLKKEEKKRKFKDSGKEKLRMEQRSSGQSSKRSKRQNDD